MITARQVSILLPAFRPQNEFLKQQLRSLNEQDYPNLELLILDDSADAGSHYAIQAACKKELSKLPHRIEVNTSNLGVNRSFEKLLHMAGGYFVAFCDQDDIWEKNKISRLIETMDKKGAQLAYSAASLIDTQNKALKPTWTLMRFAKEGCDLYRYFVGNYSIAGNRMIVMTGLAKKALPFSMYHSYDHWIALISSCYGRIAYLDEPLIRYRLHAANTLGMHRVLCRLESRSEYLDYKVLPEKCRCEDLIQSGRLPFPAQGCAIRYASWVDARLALFRTPSLKAFIRFVTGSRLYIKLAVFELILAIVPSRYLKSVFKLSEQKWHS